MLKMDDRSTEIDPSSNVTDDENDRTDGIKSNRGKEGKSKRNLIGFWLLGLCNDFGYVVMLSAAYDILAENSSNHGHQKSDNSSLMLETVGSSNSSDGMECNPLSTGVYIAN
ncbi:G1/S-specific cyclin cln3 [Desmophyllum pertusum]|uniref:G1/S-specific cyclin cln3 n=1 Tax=Desmophyllum pertusum TaxID=174260 RepID=A0A9W9ZM72_9CNID|nr:G1/S-specific cyclin cln3 [Desmophyllum pertusum]